MIARTLATGVVVLIVAGYMILDGARELSGAGYIAPGGRLGPWALVLEKLGVDPRSRGVAGTFVGYGALLLLAFALFLVTPVAGGIALIVVAALGLWYLPFGTLGCLIVIGLTVWSLIAQD